jgi:hypothetical protein
MIAAMILGYYLNDGKVNPADIVSNIWSYPKVWHLLKPLQFYYGNTKDLINPAEKEKAGNSNALR